jgi:SAM-dependent methyltransferase
LTAVIVRGLFGSSSFDLIFAAGVFHHIEKQNHSALAKEIHRVLAHGGWAFIEVPSTDGRGAWQDPTHVSFWNENSFHYYTKRSKAQYIRNQSIKFSTMLLETNWWIENVAVVNAHLVAIKNDSPRLPGPIEI